MRSDSMFVEAAKEDVPEIIALRHQIWGTTYRGIYPDDMIDNFDWAWHQEKELLRINDPAYSVYLLQKDDQNISYLTISRTDGIVLQSLYILSEYQRQGIGRAAFDFIKAYCREHGAKFFTCHCVPENLNARAFYEKMGGEDQDGLGKRGAMAELGHLSVCGGVSESERSTAVGLRSKGRRPQGAENL